MLLSLAAPQLTRVDLTGYQEPLTGADMRALASLTRLADAAIDSNDRPLPANCAWAVGQLAMLQKLFLGSKGFPADLPAALASLSHLTCLEVRSREPLPDVQPLTALSSLEELTLEEGRGSNGLAVIPTTAHPKRRHAEFTSPLLMVR